jgi:hypothetical protein
LSCRQQHRHARDILTKRKQPTSALAAFKAFGRRWMKVSCDDRIQATAGDRTVCLGQNRKRQDRLADARSVLGRGAVTHSL